MTPLLKSFDANIQNICNLMLIVHFLFIFKHRNLCIVLI
ncbi:hypothetical protein H4684_003636 [Desulfomicrobium macestii]|uniref:Uncharacterized protein n=1 Tax=Desulfomicrobium macestii TaxID=90731 RepID=A0ABR9H8A1_9BACT|nr:hypothetical protein [Desulfomicrobium macestii]